MKTDLIVAGIFLVLAAIAGGACVAMGIGKGADYNEMTGAEIFGKLCQQCHGARGTSPNGVGNSYAGKRALWDKESLLTYIADPLRAKKKIPHLRKSRKTMQAIPRTVPTAARERLVDHVLQLMDALEP